jgi:small subunit ribosomal protein S2
MLTNWRTIRGRINELERLERLRDSGNYGRVTKKEALVMSREIERLEVLLGGIRSLSRLPDLLFVVDVFREATAIHEANLLNIPVVAMVDTNCDPKNIDYVVPSNDDAIRAIKLVVGKVADAVLEGKALRKEEFVEEEVRGEAERSIVEEPELSDEELLGEATLAKLSAQVRSIIVEDEVDLGVDEELEEELEEEAEEVSEEEQVVSEEEDTEKAEEDDTNEAKE